MAPSAINTNAAASESEPKKPTPLAATTTPPRSASCAAFVLIGRGGEVAGADHHGDLQHDRGERTGARADDREDPGHPARVRPAHDRRVEEEDEQHADQRDREALADRDHQQRERVVVDEEDLRRAQPVAPDRHAGRVAQRVQQVDAREVGVDRLRQHAGNDRRTAAASAPKPTRGFCTASRATICSGVTTGADSAAAIRQRALVVVAEAAGHDQLRLLAVDGARQAIACGKHEIERRGDDP